MPINTPQQKSGSPLMGLMQMIQSIGGGSSSKTDGVLKGSDGSNKVANLPEAPDSPVDRRIDSANQSPQALIEKGFNHANDPDLPLDYETRLAVAEPLMRAKHFGYGGGQGQISNGQKSGGQGLGSVIGAVAELA